MTYLSELFRRCIAGDDEACSQIRDFIESMYLARYFRSPIPPIPQPGPYLHFDPTPTPVIEQLANHQFLIGQLVLNALDPSPQPSIFSIIQERELQLDAAQRLLAQFEQAADEMREIVEALG